MSYQINHLLSVEENLANLANTSYAPPSKAQLEVGDFTYGNPSVITPTEGNEESNTELTLTGVNGRNMYGSVVVQYKRFTLAESRPSVGTAFDITDADTLATIKAMLVTMLRLVASEFTIGGVLPTGQQTLNITAAPGANSTVYTPGNLAITLTNTSPLPKANASVYFGSTSVVATRPTFVAPLPAYTDFVSGSTGEKMMLTVLNRFASNTHTFVPGDFTFTDLGRTGEGSPNQFRHAVQFQATAQNPVIEGVGVYYTTYASVNMVTQLSMKSAYSGPAIARNADLIWAAFLAWFGVPEDQVNRGTITLGTTTATVNLTVKSTSFIYRTTEGMSSSRPITIVAA